MRKNRLENDLSHILAHTDGLWDELRGARVFVTGGTGFFGAWLLESWAWVNDVLDLRAKAVVLTRDPDAFRRRAPHLAVCPAIEFHRGDVRSFAFPAGPFSAVIHAATSSHGDGQVTDPFTQLDTIVHGTRRVLECARSTGACRFLFTSSGAVYGRQPAGLTHVGEDYLGAPDPMDSRSDYGEGKRVAELLCAMYHEKFGLETKIARCFAFVGPYLPLDAHFAIGNFIRDGMRGGPIEVGGDGTPFRSYLYAADLVIWLWTILLRGAACRPYNVGSEEDLTIAQLAATVAERFYVDWIIRKPPTNGAQPSRYVPSTERALKELGLTTRVSLEDAIDRTAQWWRVNEP